ncbi:hypothetical protein C922_05389, partial [Plasmodium inui San Antonio 1]
YTYILKNKGNIDRSCKETLLQDFQKRSLTRTWGILDRRRPAHTIQQLTDNEAIRCGSSKGGLSGDVKPRNSLLHDIGNIHIVMITDNMNILRRILQKIRYIEQSLLITGITIIIEYHRELSVAVQETLSMRNTTFSNEVKLQAKYLLNLQGEMRKIHTIQQQLKEGILVTIAILKIRNHQQGFGEIGTIMLKQYNAVINSVCDPIRKITAAEIIHTCRTILHRPASSLSYKAYSSVRRGKHHPHITRSEYSLLGIEVYRLMLLLPMLVAFTLEVLSLLLGIPLKVVLSVSYGLFALGVIGYLYVILKVSEYGQTLDGIITDYYWMLCCTDGGGSLSLQCDRNSHNRFLN